jgi:hypothetical protein
VTLASGGRRVASRLIVALVSRSPPYPVKEILSQFLLHSFCNLNLRLPNIIIVHAVMGGEGERNVKIAAETNLGAIYLPVFLFNADPSAFRATKRKGKRVTSAEGTGGKEQMSPIGLSRGRHAIGPGSAERPIVARDSLRTHLEVDGLPRARHRATYGTNRA